GIALSFFLTYSTTTITILIEWIVENTANKEHVLGILLAPIIGIIMGLALSLPTSSAAIAIAIKLHGDAATASIAGTSAQMITFGIMTYMSTKNIGKSFAVGIGSSMIQMPNFMKKPQLLLIPAIVSGITALISVSALPLEFVAGSPTSGMGTSMLYGQIFTLQENGWANYLAWFNIIFMQLMTPLILSVGLTWIAFSKKIIKKEWLKI
ncbi:MAG: PTS sugar transporter subunit IIC, partial [Mycoplasmataceae bacterium]|nr:PTS sugar transporter subunit IIC [Mycoplasmataceae bacterium]